MLYLYRLLKSLINVILALCYIFVSSLVLLFYMLFYLEIPFYILKEVKETSYQLVHPLYEYKIEKRVNGVLICHKFKTYRDYILDKGAKVQRNIKSNLAP